MCLVEGKRAGSRALHIGELSAGLGLPRFFGLALLFLEELGVDVFIPKVKLCAHGVDAVLVVFAEVGEFADVVLEVVELD